MSMPNSENRKDSTSLLPPDSDGVYKKRVDGVKAISQQLALGFSTIHDRAKFLCQCIQRFSGELAHTESPVSPDVRLALLETLNNIWNDFVSSNTTFSASINDEMARCRRSVLTAHKTLTTNNPAVASQLPQLAQLSNDLHAGRLSQHLPVPAPSVPQPLGIAGTRQSVLHPAANNASTTIVTAVGQSNVKAAGQPVVKAANHPSTKVASHSIVNAASHPIIKAANRPNITAKGPNPRISCSPAAGGGLPGGGILAKRPCPAPPSIPVSAGALRTPQLNASPAPAPAPAPSRKRKATAEQGSHTQLESQAMNRQVDADLKAQVNRLEQALLKATQEMADIRGHFAAAPKATDRASPKGPVT